MDAPQGQSAPILVESLSTRDFRNLADARVQLPAGLTVALGPNGAGKTNLLEALYFGLCGRSCRTSNDREMVRFGQGLARVELEVSETEERRGFLAAISYSEGRRHLVDGSELRGAGDPRRPPVAVFMPDRLGLIKGSPSLRRAHIDRLTAALWPARAGERQSFGRALAQRNALLGRVRAGVASGASLDAWDAEFAREAVRLMATRAEACALLSEPFRLAAGELGLPGNAALRYRPRCEAVDQESLIAQLRELRQRDIDRGHATHGPHLDEVELSLAERSLRRYGSQGEQRGALLALLFAERELLLALRGVPPLMLLDDVMSELDPDRRRLLVERLGQGGQALITATHAGQLPDMPRHELRVAAGAIVADHAVAVAA